MVLFDKQQEIEGLFGKLLGGVCTTNDQCIIPPYLAYCDTEVGFTPAIWDSHGFTPGQPLEGQCRPGLGLWFFISIPILLSFLSALLCCWFWCSGPCKCILDCLCCCSKVTDCRRRNQARRIAEREVRQDEEIDREIRVARHVVAAISQSVNQAPRRPHRGRRQGERDMVSLPMIDWQGSAI